MKLLFIFVTATVLLKSQIVLLLSKTIEPDFFDEFINMTDYTNGK